MDLTSYNLFHLTFENLQNHFLFIIVFYFQGSVTVDYRSYKTKNLKLKWTE